MTHPSIPIAIVGAGCHFPGGRDLDAFFQFLLGGSTAITDLPPERYDASLYYDAKRGSYGRSYCWKGAMLDLHGIPVPAVAPELAERLDPLQKLALGVAAETFASAGLLPAQLAGRDIPVILGASRPGVQTFDHAFAHAIEHLVEPLREAMEGDSRARAVCAEVVRSVRDRYSRAGDDLWPPALGRQVAGLVANAYGLTGRHAVIDAACASTFAALATGKRALEQRSADMVLVGGASVFDPYTLVMFAQSRALTDDGSYPFDARASGFVPGEGCGMFLLERLDDALAHGRTILGVVRAVGSACDGAGKATWAPRREGQVLAIERAYAGGQVEPAEVELIEAHATSTRLGDATEIAALGEFFGRGGARAPMLIGTVKGNIGHALSAAGAAGLAKVLGVFRHGTVPPSIGYSTPNPDIQWERVPLRIVTAATPAGACPRIAALDSFGIGGLNYHVVVEAPPSLARAEELVRRAVAPVRSSIAIVGAGAFLAGARSIDEIARVVASGEGTFRRLPASRVSLDTYYQAGASARWRTYASDAALVDAPAPDAQQIKIPPKLLANYDPLQFIILDAANQALAGIGNCEASDRARVAVFVGSSQVSDFFIDLTLAVRLPEVARFVDAALGALHLDEPARARIVAGYLERARRLLPALTEESSANVGSGLASRTAKALDVHGSVLAIDSGGTGSSLAAFEAAVEALRAGDCDLAIVGGGDRALRIDRLASACASGELAGGPGGGGHHPGEGAVMVALRRLDDAVAAGDTVLATVAAIGSATAGDLSRTHRPGSDTVERAVTRALQRGDVAPARVQYLVTDALAAGGDAPDVVALDRCYGGAASDPLPLGSVPPLFGRCDGATGIASVVMALGALQGRAAPPARALRDRLGTTPGRLHAFAEPVPLRATSDAAVAVTSAGEWGTQYHVVLAAAGAATTRRPASATAAVAAREPIVFRAPSRTALGVMLQALRGHDLSRFSPGETVGDGEVAVALRASTLKDSLEIALTALASTEAVSLASQGVAIADAPLVGATCFLFPGLGSPYEGMLRALVEAYPAAARRLAEIDALVEPLAGRTMSDVLEREPRLLVETVEWAKFASLTANLVTFEVAATHGFTPAFVSGHSFGEYAAFVVAGAISLPHAVRMTAARAAHVARTTCAGAMASVFASRARIAELLDGLPGFAAASNINSPEEIVVSGEHHAVAALLERCRRENVHAKQLTVPAPFHCELMRPACEPFAREVADVPIRRPHIPVISSVTSREISDPEDIRRALVDQLIAPVDFIAQIEYAYAQGVTRFIETGAGNVLARLTAKIIGRRPAVVVSFDERRKREKTGAHVVENALTVLRANEGRAARAEAPPARPPALAPTGGDPSALFTADEWRQLSQQPDWAPFWMQVVPSLALLARDLYARHRSPAQPNGVHAASGLLPTVVPSAEPRPTIKTFDTTTMRRAERAQAPTRRPETNAPPSTSRSAPPELRDLAQDFGALLTDLVVQQTGYPRELLRFDQELEADLGIDTVKQVELLGKIRQELDLPADEAVSISDLPTLAQLRDHIVGKLSTRAVTNSAPASQSALVAEPPSGRGRLADEVSGILVDLVVQHTGYPRELVRFDQELEADLGIDTVKQVALLGSIREQLDLPTDEAVSISDLPTLAQLRDYVVTTLSSDGARAAAGWARPRARAPHNHAAAPDGGSDDEDAPPGADALLGERIDISTLPGVAAPGRVLSEVAETSQRLVPRPRLEALPSAGVPYRPARIVVVGEGEVAAEVTRALEARGASVTRRGFGPGADPHEHASAFVGELAPDLCLATACARVPLKTGQHLAAVASLLDPARLDGLIELLRAWLRRVGSSRATLSAVTSLGGLFGHANLAGASLEGAGLIGLLRALRHEHPALRIKAVDVDAWAPADDIARSLLAELDGACPKLWAGWFRGERRVPGLVVTPPPSIDDARLERLRGLPYVLVTGGARGITVELSIRLAELGIRRLHLVGRTPLPDDLARWHRLAASGELRDQMLVELRSTGRAFSPAAWERDVARVEAALEISRNLARLDALGASVRYHAADLGDGQQVAELLATVRDADGPVRAIVHGAGTQRSRALLGKPLGDFHDTLAPKLAGAVHLMELTAGDPVELFVCLSSVAGQFGNLGQADYGLASAALDTLMAAYAAKFPARRACAIAWPAWDEVGMAVRGGTREQLERRGRQLMSVAEGGNHFVREILAPPGEGVVVIAGSSVGDPDGQRPSPAQLEALNGVTRAAATLPLVDAVAAVDPVEIQIEHHAHAGLDAYLADHVLGGAALLPGVVALELLAEAASVARGGERIDVLEDVEIEHPFKLAPDTRGVLRAFARLDGDAHDVRLVARHVDRIGRLVEAERVLVTGRARRGVGDSAPPAWREVVGQVVPYQYRTPTQADATHVLHGPSLRTLVELVVGQDGWHTARLHALPAGALRASSAGAWCVPAPLLDGCLAACGAVLSMRGIAGLPRGFGRIELWHAPLPHEECRALLHERAHDNRHARFDFTVWGADDRVLFVVSDFVRRSFD